MNAPIKLDPQVEWPDHTQLPDNDGVPVRNSIEILQSDLLTHSLTPVLSRLYPDGNYFIGQGNGIYWMRTDPPMAGCRSPDWYLVPDVSATLNGEIRRSYVLWQELVAPLILLEYASDGGDEERDDTPGTGKFWIYERRIRPAFYGIFLPDDGRIEMYHLVEDRLEPMSANAQGRFPIPSLKVELGVWDGRYDRLERTWMRWWDVVSGQLLPTPEERGDALRMQMEQERQRAEQERQRAEQEHQRAEQERQRAERLAERLRTLGINPDEV